MWIKTIGVYACWARVALPKYIIAYDLQQSLGRMQVDYRTVGVSTGSRTARALPTCVENRKP